MRSVTTVWRLGLFAAASVSLAACGTTGNSITGLDYPTRNPGGSPNTIPPGGAAAPQKIGRPYQVNGRWYTPQADPDYNEVGVASWYGEAFQGKPTASGEPFDMNQISAAHKTLPLPSIVEVTDLGTGRSIQVRVNDRGPFVDGRIIDLSKAAAEALGTRRAGVARVRVRYVGPAPAGPLGRTQLASAAPPQREYARIPQTPPAVAMAAIAAPVMPAPPPVYIPPAPAYAPPEPVYVAPPEPTIQLASYSVVDDPAASFPINAPPAAGAWTVRAGFYPELAGAEQAVDLLSASSSPQIRLARIGGEVVYEVVIDAIPDPIAASIVQRQVMAGGFPGAQVLNP